MTHEQLQQGIIDVATVKGWLVYHARDSRKSTAGFPDLVLVHPLFGIVFAELKVGKDVVSAAQQAWLDAIDASTSEPGSGVRTFVWRESDWTSGAIEHALFARPR